MLMFCNWGKEMTCQNIVFINIGILMNDNTDNLEL